MTDRRRGAALVIALAAALVVPAAARAHASLLRTVPSASVVVNSSPGRVSLTYSEAVEPRFAIVSVTDAAGHQQAASAPRRSPSNPDTLVVPVRRASEGWYLVYWRVISADGHPVRGAFTYAVGPNPGPAPQFSIPSTSETAATPLLLVTRWLVFLTTMAAIGLFVLRAFVVRPMVARVPGASLRALSIAFAAAVGAALIATPVYVLVATARFALRSTLDLGATVPLARASAFGRGFLDLELVLLLLAAAGLVTIAIDRPRRPERSVAELIALLGAVAAAASALLVPGLAGHAAQTAPRGLSIVLDWSHLAAGSVWIGGLLGLLVLWLSLEPGLRTRALSIAVPRFSRTAFVSVLVLVGSGTGATLIHLPTLATLWQTSYGKTILVKIGILLGTMCLAGVNLTRTVPRLTSVRAGNPDDRGATLLLRRLVGGEAVLVGGAIFAAAVLSSLPPPPKALGSIGKASAHVGPGPVTRTVKSGAYRLVFRVTPNQAAVPNAFAVRITRGGRPVDGADVTATFTMLDMEMQQLAYRLAETAPGTYERSAPALVMVGRWGLSFEIRPRGRTPFTVLLVDRAHG